MKEISLSIPNFMGNELKYVTEAIEAGWVSTGGEFITRFENSIKDFVQCEYAVAVQSGTAAIHLALIACGVTRGDAVIVPSLTFIAAVNPVMYVGAEPIFMDCDDSLCMDPVKVESFIRNECSFGKELVHKKTGKKIQALIVVDIFGNCADKEKFRKICSDFNIMMIEDSTESLGSRNENGRYMGTIGDVGVYSFNGNKIMTTGGGGMLVTNNKEIADKCRYLSTQAKDDALYFVHNEIGYNYRLTNIQAAVGLAQVETLQNFIDIKKKNYENYQSKLSEIGLSLLPFRSNTNPNFWFYSLIVKDAEDRDALIKWLSAKNIQARPIWHVLHLLKPYKNCEAYEIDKAIYYWEHIVNIPCSTSLTLEEMDIVVEALGEYYHEN